MTIKLLYLLMESGGFDGELCVILSLSNQKELTYREEPIFCFVFLATWGSRNNTDISSPYKVDNKHELLLIYTSVGFGVLFVSATLSVNILTLLVLLLVSSASWGKYLAL